MGYQIIDGFDLYGNAQNLVAGYPWDTIQGTPSEITSDFRFAPPAGIPGGCLLIPNDNFIRKNLSSAQTTIICGFGIKCLGLPSSTADIFQLWSSNGCVFCLAVTTTGQLQFYVGNGAAPGSGGAFLITAVGSPSASGTIVANSWTGIQIQVTIATAGGGSIACYVNGSTSPAIIASGVTTSPGTATVNQASIGNTTNTISAGIHYDDCFIFDGSGANYNSLQSGDPRVISLIPNGVGFYTNWTPNGLANNYSNVSQIPANTSDYNANNILGTKDSWGMTNPGINVAPLAVVVRGSVYKDDGTTHTPSFMMRSGTTDGVGAALPAIGSTPLYYDTPFVNDPATSAAWTAAGINAAQLGIVEG